MVYETLDLSWSESWQGAECVESYAASAASNSMNPHLGRMNVIKVWRYAF